MYYKLQAALLSGALFMALTAPSIAMSVLHLVGGAFAASQAYRGYILSVTP